MQGRGAGGGQREPGRWSRSTRRTLVPMPRPRTTKTTYPGLFGERIRRVTTDGRGNRHVTYSNGLVEDVFKAFGFVLLALLFLIAIVVVLIVALVGVVVRSKSMKHLPSEVVQRFGDTAHGKRSQ